MKLSDILLLSLGATFIIIGIAEMMTRGIENGYWAVMLSVVFFFLYIYRKKR